MERQFYAPCFEILSRFPYQNPRTPCIRRMYISIVRKCFSKSVQLRPTSLLCDFYSRLATSRRRFNVFSVFNVNNASLDVVVFIGMVISLFLRLRKPQWKYPKAFFLLLIKPSPRKMLCLNILISMRSSRFFFFFASSSSSSFSPSFSSFLLFAARGDRYSHLPRQKEK